MNSSIAKFRNWITSADAYTFKMSVRTRLALLLPIFVLIGGCYSSHSGSIKVTVGNATFLPELSTKSGSLHLRLLESINGAVIYAPSNSCTSIWYHNKSKTSYLGIIESEDSKSLSTIISNHHTTNDDQRKDGQQHKNNKAPDAKSEKVTADAPITKRCDGQRNHSYHNPYIPYWKVQTSLTAIQQSLSDPSVAQAHLSIQYKTQNITTAQTSRDCQYQYLKTHERSNQIGFRAFPYLLCRDRSNRDNLLLIPS